MSITMTSFTTSFISFLKSSELTKDLTQDVYVKLWDGRSELPQLLSVKSHLLTVAKHHAFNFLKRTDIDQNAKAEILRHYPAAGASLESVIHFNDYKRYLDELPSTLSRRAAKCSTCAGGGQGQ